MIDVGALIFPLEVKEPFFFGKTRKINHKNSRTDLTDKIRILNEQNCVNKSEKYDVL